jgi:hypothetical protein
VTTGPQPVLRFFGARLDPPLETRLFVVVILAGAIGAMIHTLRSVSWYVGNREFRYSWLLLYVSLPFVGGALALVSYLVLRGGLTSSLATGQDINPFGVTAVAGLVGLFTQETTVKLKEVFSTLLAPAEKGKDQVAEPRIEAIDPAQGPPGTTVTIIGSGLSAVTSVRIGRTRVAPTIVSDSELTFIVPADATDGSITLLTPAGPTQATAQFTVTSGAQ